MTDKQHLTYHTNKFNPPPALAHSDPPQVNSSEDHRAVESQSSGESKSVGSGPGRGTCVLEQDTLP